MPDCGLIRVEVPRTGLLWTRIPIDFYSVAIAVILNDRTCRLNSHGRDGLPAIIKRQIVFLRKHSLDGNTVADFHAFNLVEETILPAVLPYAFGKKTFCLVLRIVILPIRANHPVIDAFWRWFFFHSC